MNYNNFAARLKLPEASRLQRAERPDASHLQAARKKARQLPAGKRIAKILRTSALAASLFGAFLGTVRAASYTADFDQPSIDKWQYPFGGAGGTRTNASTFGAVGSAGFEDRDAEFYNAFNTGSAVPVGLGAANYTIRSATFTLTLGVGSNGTAPDVTFDGSYDPISSYGANGEPVNGDDAGRSIELYGVAYRGGLTNTTVAEDSPFGTSGEGTRNLYPTDFSAGASLSAANRDVASNVTNAFDAIPFAIGQVASEDLTEGKINADADLVFTLNLENPDVVRYLQLSLDEGRVSFLVTSLHIAAQGGPTIYPVYYTKENLLGGAPGRLDLQVDVVPEPSAFWLMLGGLAWVGTVRRRRSFSRIS